ncbi:hypothetical protein J5N97_003050 [Dioscorea zingiberensis]|uniref:Uncharacterized protein n=1 Tax=Dioscorea zingiberensis TaxID=325984 RepID=A0A9D5HQ00_9LILI|nr:hypothetical protein J5N97_003050 [Dioscorea zingiberensis]
MRAMGRWWGAYEAVSGYQTEGQGRFDQAAECYHPGKERWVRIEGIWDEGGGAPSVAFVSAGEWLGYVDGRGAREYEKGWKGGRTVAMAIAARERVLAMGLGFREWEVETG